MQDVTNHDLLKRNIVKYSWFRIFTKRVYLPLITVQLVNVGKVSLDELALMVVSYLVYYPSSAADASGLCGR